jgi:membrane-associated phospholipid phosphatase
MCVKAWLRQLFKTDTKISKKLRFFGEKKFLSLLFKAFAHSGDSWFWLIGLFLVWLFSDGAWHDRAAFLTVGLFVMAGAVIILKFAIRRPRPEGEWGQIYRITDPHSFPSGHAARSAALVVMAIAIGPPWFAVTLALWAPWVGLSRVVLGVHYLSDVIVGWVVGAAMGGIAVLLKPWIMAAIDVVLGVVIG